MEKKKHYQDLIHFYWETLTKSCTVACEDTLNECDVCAGSRNLSVQVASCSYQSTEIDNRRIIVGVSKIFSQF